MDLISENDYHLLGVNSHSPERRSIFSWILVYVFRKNNFLFLRKYNK